MASSKKIIEKLSAADADRVTTTSSRYWVKKTPRQLIAETEHKEHQLKKSLTWVDLTLLGIGGVIGAGIFVLTGTAARNFAGDAMALSYILAGFVCVFAAMSYAELASMIPVSGSAYTFAYASLGELPAWIIGWALFLEYLVGSMAVAVAWSGHVREFVDVVLGSIGIPEIPARWAAGPFTEVDPVLQPGVTGFMNLPALLGVLALTVILIVGIRESARFAGAMVLVKVAAIIFIIGVGIAYIEPDRWFTGPTFPTEQSGVGLLSAFGFNPGGAFGILAGAAVVFFAYIGFDAVSTAAEETKNPKRDLPIGIILSLAICTLLYVLAAAVITGMVDYQNIDTVAPFVVAFRDNGLDWAAGIIASAAMAGITSVLLVLMLGQTRIFFALSRDGLLPSFFARVHPRFRTPMVATIITGSTIALVAAFLPIDILAELTSIGTLFAFILANVGVVILRRTAPDMPRGFRVPGGTWVPVTGAVLNVVLMLALQLATWVVFVLWMGLGLVIYALYGIHRSRLFGQLVGTTPSPRATAVAAEADGGRPDRSARAPK